MKGLMQEFPLTLPLVFRRAARESHAREVITARDHRATWGDVARRGLRLCRVLEGLGLEHGDRVGSFAWNTQRHLELYLATPCSGRVLHTVNIRLHPEQVAWLIGHAEDRVLFVDASLTPALEPIRDRLTGVRTFVVMEDGPDPAGAFADDPRYEDLLEPEAAEFVFPELEESEAAFMCYTSGTTGNPKGVVYSHRSVVLHAMAALQVDTFGVSGDDTILPVTPMFHVAAWGLPYAAALAGAKLVLPGRNTDPQPLARLIEAERVTITCGVPTIWARFIDLVDSGSYDLSSLRRILVGGAAIAESLIARYEEHRIEVRRGWGMTEMSPSGTMSRPGTPTLQGVVVPGVELRICDEAGSELPWDGHAVGEIEARGPWIARAYHAPDDDANEARFHDGWLRTGDVGSISPNGDLRVVDRTKDLVKSGGEWISTIELEQRLAAHPGVLEAAVVARPDPEWDERPVAFVVGRPGTAVSGDELEEFLRRDVASWWVPDDFAFVEELPKTSVGKIDKRELRRRAGERSDAAA
jgi:fatty-acyl-CoA synthase